MDGFVDGFRLEDLQRIGFEIKHMECDPVKEENGKLYYKGIISDSDVSFNVLVVKHERINETIVLVDCDALCSIATRMSATSNTKALYYEKLIADEKKRLKRFITRFFIFVCVSVLTYISFNVAIDMRESLVIDNYFMYYANILFSAAGCFYIIVRLRGVFKFILRR